MKDYSCILVHVTARMDSKTAITFAFGAATGLALAALLRPCRGATEKESDPNQPRRFAAQKAANCVRALDIGRRKEKDMERALGFESLKGHREAKFLGIGATGFASSQADKPPRTKSLRSNPSGSFVSSSGVA